MSKTIITKWLDGKRVTPCYDLECENRRPQPATFHCKHGTCEYRIQNYEEQCYLWQCPNHPRNNGDLYGNACDARSCKFRRENIEMTTDEIRARDQAEVDEYNATHNGVKAG